MVQQEQEKKKSNEMKLDLRDLKMDMNYVDITGRDAYLG